jgi:hypothetical protein
MTAIGQVLHLDASPLFEPEHPHAGKVLVTIVCTEEQAHAWGQLWGREVEAKLAEKKEGMR